MKKIVIFCPKSISAIWQIEVKRTRYVILHSVTHWVQTPYKVAFRLFRIKISYDTFLKFVIYSPTENAVSTYIKT